MILHGSSVPVAGDRYTLPVIPHDQIDSLWATYPCAISEPQEQSLARKQKVFIVYGSVTYNDADGMAHDTGFAGIYDISTQSFTRQADNSEYEYQR
jgi:hypothetical protein